MKTISPCRLWAKIMVIVGSIGIVAGALDPLEGSVVILIGSALVALGTFLGQGERHLIRYRTLAFILTAVGVGAMFGLSAVGGFGGRSGLSVWWGMLILPYLVGWSMSIWGPGNPRWFWCLGIAVGIWYLALASIALSRPSKEEGTAALVVTLGTIGLVTIGGCITRLVIAIRNSELDNNLVENAIRPTAIGKKNFLFVGHPEAGQRSAVIYSVLGSCRRHGINPAEYLRDVFERLPKAKTSELKSLTRAAWAKMQRSAQRLAGS